MTLRYSHIAILAWMLLFCGCIQRGSLNPDAEVISFQAQAPLVQNSPGTKTGVIKTGTTFKDSGNDRMAVFGWHNGEPDHPERVFQSETERIHKIVASFNGPEIWPYLDSPTPWDWKNTTTDYYDFLAVYPATAAPDAATTSAANPHLVISNTYAPTRSSQYDLMVDGVRRTADETSRDRTVAFNFTHRLCAVKVIIKNDSASDASFTLHSYYFKNMITRADWQAALDAGVVNFTWSNPQRSSDPFLGSDPGSDLNRTLPSSGTESERTYDPGTANAATGTETGFDLMVPQTLSPAGIKPAIFISYTKATDANPTTKSVSLQNIPVKTGSGPQNTIDAWEPGKKYIYEITIRVGGGVIVNVITTEWDEVEAETPGLLIS